MGESTLRAAGLRRHNDTRLLLAGVAVVLALMAYLAVAFANTHPAQFASLSSKVAPWSPHASDFAAIPLEKGGYAVRVTPAGTRPAPGGWGAVVQTLVPDPTPGGTYLVSVRLQGARPGRIAVELNEFRSGQARYPIQTTVPATARWRKFTFRLRVKGRWLGLALYVYRADRRQRSWFAVRDLKAELLRP